MKHIILLALALTICGCNGNKQRAVRDIKQSGAVAEMAPKIETTRPTITIAEGIDDKTAIEEVVKTILASDYYREKIESLNGVDMATMVSKTDYFTNPTTKSRLVHIEGDASTPSGAMRNLLILIENGSVLWAGQFASIDKIVDVNSDGIKDIITSGGSMWMGEVNEWYEIFNFADGHRQTHIKTESFQTIEETNGKFGLLKYPDYVKRGDTLMNHTSNTLIRGDGGKYQLKQIQTLITTNGEGTEADIINKLETTTNTKIIRF